jgi:uncharacterized protein
MKKYILILCTVCFHLYLGLYSDSLKQVNKETLFLDSDNLTEFNKFRENISERKVLLTRINYSKKIDQTLFEELENYLQKLNLDLGENSKIITPKMIYPKSAQGSFSKLLQFINEHPSLLLNLVGEKDLSFLTIFPEDTKIEQISQFIEQIEKGPVSHIEKVHFSGMPYTNYLLGIYSEQIKEKIFPILFILSFIFTALFTKSLLASGAIFIPALFSLFFSLASIKFLYHDLNMITSIVPLIIFVINLVFGFHIYFTALELGDIKSAFKEKIGPIILMVVTTSIGFGSLIFSKIEVIQQFAIISSLCIVFTTFLTGGWLYTIFEILPFKFSFPQYLTKIFPAKAFKRPLPLSAILILSVIFIIYSLSIIPSIEIITDATLYFPKKSGIKQSIDLLQKKLVGNPNFELVINREDGEELEYSDLLKISEFENSVLEKLSKYKILSSNTFVANANYMYTGVNKLPPVSIAYFSLRSQLDSDLKEAHPALENYRMAITGNTVNHGDYVLELEVIKSLIKKFPQYNFQINGLYYNLMLSQGDLIKVLAYSFLTSLIIISLISFFYFKKLKILLVFIFTNTIPVFLSLIFIHTMKLSLNIATVMTFSISLGMIVDSTIHLTKGILQKQSYEFIYKTTLIPILATSCLLIISFTMFFIHDFLPIKQFGPTLGFTLFVGLLFDLYVLPSLLKS